MDQQGQTGPQGPAGRRLHIAHRRSPSEMTPLMSMYLILESAGCSSICDCPKAKDFPR
jgi:hypothetical protein